MARMIRKQIVIEPEQESALAKLAQERGVSQGALIREAVERMLEEAQEAEDKRLNHERLMAYFEKGMDLGLSDENGNRTWTRESLYEGRGVLGHDRDRVRRGSLGDVEAWDGPRGSRPPGE
jgi:hypothetical protein